MPHLVAARVAAVVDQLAVADRHALARPGHGVVPAPRPMVAIQQHAVLPGPMLAVAAGAEFRPADAVHGSARIGRQVVAQHAQQAQVERPAHDRLHAVELPHRPLLLGVGDHDRAKRRPAQQVGAGGLGDQAAIAVAVERRLAGEAVVGPAGVAGGDQVAVPPAGPSSRSAGPPCGARCPGTPGCPGRRSSGIRRASTRRRSGRRRCRAARSAAPGRRMPRSRTGNGRPGTCSRRPGARRCWPATRRSRRGPAPGSAR